ncbi:MAG: alpha/beta hydrolase [Myxococcota bacterium]
MSLDSNTYLPGIESATIQTRGLKAHFLQSGHRGGEPVLFIHGNASSSVFYEEAMLALPKKFHALALDVRGYGDTQYAPTDATQGAREAAADIRDFLDALGITQPVHLLGWSLGGGWAMQFLLDHPERVRSLTLEAPVSPFGFGGTKDAQGTWAFDDAALSGAGGVAPDFPARLGAKDRSAESPLSPRNVLNAFYVKPPFKLEREEELLTGLLKMRVDEGHYPGDAVTSANWPGSAPGVKGVLNAFSPKYFNTSGMVNLAQKPPILWVRGADDQVVSNTSFWDVAFLGMVGAIPGWPGADVAPPQPMIDQTRAVLEQYQANGGTYREVVFESCGHSPHLERPADFMAALIAHIERA